MKANLVCFDCGKVIPWYKAITEEYKGKEIVLCQRCYYGEVKPLSKYRYGEVVANITRLPSKYKVIIEQMIVIGRRTKPEPVQRTFTILAYTYKQALKAVRDAGVKGKPISVVKLNTGETEPLSKYRYGEVIANLAKKNPKRIPRPSLERDMLLEGIIRNGLILKEAGKKVPEYEADISYLKTLSTRSLRNISDGLRQSIFYLQRERGLGNPSSLYKSFHGLPPAKIRKVNINIPKKLIKIGRCEAVLYQPEPPSRRSNIVYQHRWGDTGVRMLKNKPILAVSPNGKEFFLIKDKSRAKFSARGIVG